MGGFRIGGPDASGLNLGAVQAGSVGFTVHVLATLELGEGGDVMTPYAIFEGDPDGPSSDGDVWSQSKITHYGPGNNKVGMSGWAKSMHAIHATGATKHGADLPNGQPTLFTFTKFEEDDIYLAMWVDGVRLTRVTGVFTNEVGLDHVRGSMFVGIVWPERGTGPPPPFLQHHPCSLL